jgi:hypothetical protein
MYDLATCHFFRGEYNGFASKRQTRRKAGTQSNESCLGGTARLPIFIFSAVSYPKEVYLSIKYYEGARIQLMKIKQLFEEKSL